ncbi:MAG: hypothetical protein OXH04_03145, partial [Acidobacteria bacterium]|nr:hypothetical protein [Acidobacteriota bacterium]
RLHLLAALHGPAHRHGVAADARGRLRGGGLRDSAAMSDPTAWYDAHADELSDRYEAVPPQRVHGWLLDVLPSTPATALDVGTGSGRDAAWLSRRGLVALTWLRLYTPLLRADLPQSPINTRGADRLGFARAAFERLDATSHHDLRVGTALDGEAGAALHQALKDAARTIEQMPVRHMTYPNEPRSILPVDRRAGGRRSTSTARLDASYLASFGTMRVPIHLWLPCSASRRGSSRPSKPNGCASRAPTRSDRAGLSKKRNSRPPWRGRTRIAT